MEAPKVFATHPEVLDLEPGTYYWCACGRAAKGALCDGSHKGTDCRPLKFEVTDAGPQAICLCKHSAMKPYCDGSHKQL
jgi:CDGSH iron-sulfur domain-containing protein 3